MSTRATIAIRNADNTYEGIYCHFGHPEEAYPVLTKHYANTEKLRDLLALGSISYVDEQVAPKEGQEHSYGNTAPGVTVAYHRDRGESLQPSEKTEEIRDFELNGEHVYVWDEQARVWEHHRV